jgi:hypothetical protein
MASAVFPWRKKVAAQHTVICCSFSAEWRQWKSASSNRPAALSASFNA